MSGVLVVDVRCAPATVAVPTMTPTVVVLPQTPATLLLDSAGAIVAPQPPADPTPMVVQETTVVVLPQAPAAMLVDLGGVGPQGPPGPVDLAVHDALDSLAHDVAESSDTEFAYDGDGRLQRLTVWTNATRTTKIRERLVSYAGDAVSTTIERQYNNAGAVLATLTRTFVYDGNGVLLRIDAVRS